MDYNEARSWLESLGEFHMEFGLDRVRTTLGALGNPERCAPAIHVAGTNGKGMTCAFASSILRHAGKRVGLYTSPHLSRPNERIAIGGVPIGDAGFATALSRVRSTMDATNTPLTYFEAITCAAFAAFEALKVEAMVIEVGLGGRLDATNVIDPVVSVITSIALDHTAILGTTLDEIAREKAGIVKPGRPVVIPDHAPELRRAVESMGGSRIWICGATGEVGWEPGPGATGIRLPGDRPGRPPVTTETFSAVTLNGASAMAAVACRLFDEKISHAEVYAGIRDAHWPGRAEYRQWTDPGGHRRFVLLDGAHNPAAAEELARQGIAFNPKGHVLLFAAMNDKDRLGMLRAHATNAPGAIVCTSAGTPRSTTARQLAEEARSVFGDRVPIESRDAIDSALTRAAELAGSQATILVTGSLYLVGRVREIVTGGPPAKIG